MLATTPAGRPPWATQHPSTTRAVPALPRELGVLADLNDENLKRDAALLNTAHTGTVLGVGCDVTKEEDVQGMIREAVKFGGRIDILFNDAGAGFAASFDKQTNQDWEKAFAPSATRATF